MIARKLNVNYRFTRGKLPQYHVMHYAVKLAFAPDAANAELCAKVDFCMLGYLSVCLSFHGV